MSAARVPHADAEPPFEVLGDGHERLRRMLRLMQWLRLHLAAMGRDGQARQAARELVHFFDRTMPLHHEDEERHVFPPLLAAGQCVEAVQRLQREHLEMAQLWPAVRTVLRRRSDGPGLAPADDAVLDRFVRLYDWHLAAEDELVFPAAARCLDAAALADIGEQMSRRRGRR